MSEDIKTFGKPPLHHGGPYMLLGAAADAPLPTDPAARKAVPLFSGLMAYFPDALAEVARVSKAGNDQHNPGQPLHWSREKSNDHPDCAARHLLEHGGIDTDKQRHTAKLCWRALAMLQLEIEADRALVALKR